jgi:hypothetical protein
MVHDPPRPGRSHRESVLLTGLISFLEDEGDVSPKRPLNFTALYDLLQPRRHKFIKIKHFKPPTLTWVVQ